MWKRDENGVLHVIALSGGHDSTALAFLLKDREPRPYNYVCTPTGDELPEMFAHWRNLGERLGSLLYPMSRKTLDTVIREQKTLPNFRIRYCTRILKIEPYREFLEEQAKIGPVVSYVGLRYDEPGRAGGAYSDIEGVTMRFPLREWEMDEDKVQDTLRHYGITCPDRTDCAVCYHQRIGEWWELWANHPDKFEAGCQIEEEFSQTFRTPGRDTWPSSLREMGKRFAAGDKPTISLNRMKRERETQKSGTCRVCSL